MAALAAVASKPSFLLDTLLVKDKNSAGIIGVNFFIRGKPWTVSIDESLVVQGSGTFTIPVFAQLDESKTNYWAALYEKAWGKVKGSFDLEQGGFFQTGIRALTGVPVFNYKTKDITTTA